MEKYKLPVGSILAFVALQNSSNIAEPRVTTQVLVWQGFVQVSELTKEQWGLKCLLEMYIISPKQSFTRGISRVCDFWLDSRRIFNVNSLVDKSPDLIFMQTLIF